MAAAGGGRLPARSTRGNRMGQLLNEEGDEEFWAQEAFAEDEKDDEYVSEAEEADQFDSDFNESEDDDDDDDGEEDERPRKRAALRPPGEPKRHKPPPGANKPVRALSALEGAVAGVEGGAAPSPRPKAPKPVVEVTADMVRTSKRATVLELNLQRERAAAEAALRPKPKARRPVEDRPLTQEEMLAEAVHTEQLNTAALASILAREEESKSRAAVVKKTYTGPLVRFRSTRAGGETLTFQDGAEKALMTLCGPPPARPPRAICAVTGAPARYRDPQTGKPYANAAALKVLRANAAAAGHGGTAAAGVPPPPAPPAPLRHPGIAPAALPSVPFFAHAYGGVPQPLAAALAMPPAPPAAMAPQSVFSWHT